MAFELGIISFGEITPDPFTGTVPGAGQRIEDLIEQAELADKVGLDVFGLGEHHRSDFAISAPAVVLAAMAARTSHIHLTSAVTVLSSDDPVQVFQQFATLDLISRGRAELIVGRGSYTESFPLFGYDLADYDALFAEKLELLLALRAEQSITWSGTFRPPLESAVVAPRPYQSALPIWIAVGGTPASVVRAAAHNVPLALAIIGGAWSNFRQFVDLYRQALTHYGHEPTSQPVSINSLGFIAETRERAFDIGHPYFAAGFMENFHTQGRGIAMPRQAFEAQSTLDGAYFVGDPDDIVAKILAQHDLFGHQRFQLQLGFGGTPQAETLKAIELFGREVAPRVRNAVAAREGR